MNTKSGANARGADLCCVGVCYKVTGTDLTNPANSFTRDWSFCFEDSDFGEVCNMSGPTFLFNFAAFPEVFPQVQAISFTGGQGAYMKFIGNNEDTLNGLYYNGADRFQIHGVEETCQPFE